MNKKILLLLVLICGGMLFMKISGSGEGEPAQTVQAEREQIASLVENFGAKLQMVSLQAPPQQLQKSMQENYGDFVSATLLKKWLSSPQEAPGRLTSSPWPDRIEILSIKKLAADAYAVEGKIIEISSTERDNEVAASRPISLTVKSEEKWLIAQVTLSDYEEPDSIVYRNAQYGFAFSLPQSWTGYTIVTDVWKGFAVGSSKQFATGPLVTIRHPDWTAEKPRQDIPIMIFTLAQWNLLQQDKFHIGAAPIGPRELGRNSSYVFALPARYNFAFPDGYKEVEAILDRKTLQPFELPQ